MLLELKNMTGIRPSLNGFGLPPSASCACSNIKFENGCIVPLLGYHYPSPDTDGYFDHINGTDSNIGEIGDFLTLNPNSVVRPQVQIIKPNYIESVTGNQSVWVWYMLNSNGSMLSSTTDLYPNYTSLRDRTGYTISVDPIPKQLAPGVTYSWDKVSTRGYVHKIWINSEPMQPRPLPVVSDPLFPSGNLVLESVTNGKPVTLTISANSMEVKAATTQGNGYAPNENPHISGSFYVRVQESYGFSASFKFKFSIVNDNGDTIFTSSSSESEFMDVGDGIYVHIPRITIEDSSGAKSILDTVKYIKLFRSLNSGSYKEVDFTYDY